MERYQPEANSSIVQTIQKLLVLSVLHASPQLRHTNASHGA